MNLLPATVTAIDEMVARVDRFRVDPDLAREVKWRLDLTADFHANDEELLGRMIALIAYSNTARADKVTPLVENGVFQRVFQNYSLEKVAALSVEDLIHNHWAEIKAMRFKYKVDACVRCAAFLLSSRNQDGSFMKYLEKAGLPSVIQSESDIRTFWQAFNRIQADLWASKIPYFGNFTSLCHLLMDRGFDCAKPDLAVMKAAVDLGVVPAPAKQKNNPTKSSAHPEESLRKTVETVQAYAICRKMRAPVVDLYFLIQGRQSGVVTLVQPGFYL